jgi:hypothetical protein
MPSIRVAVRSNIASEAGSIKLHISPMTVGSGMDPIGVMTAADAERLKQLVQEAANKALEAGVRAGMEWGVREGIRIGVVEGGQRVRRRGRPGVPCQPSRATPHDGPQGGGEGYGGQSGPDRRTASVTANLRDFDPSTRWRMSCGNGRSWSSSARISA